MTKNYLKVGFEFCKRHEFVLLCDNASLDLFYDADTSFGRI
jgi:aspartate/methionine/tyrosine aminotransferase